MKKLILMAVALLATGLVSAQSDNEIITKFNDGVAAIQGKDFSKAVELLEAVIGNGIDSENDKVLGCVQNAKKYLPTCYQNLGMAAASRKDYTAAIENLTMAAEKAELYGNSGAKAKANTVLAKVYQVQGGEAFNNADYETAVTVFEKGYAANPRNTDMALNLAESYFKLGEYRKGMDVCTNITALPAEKYADAIASARDKMSMYTNNEVARMQAAGDNDGILAMAEEMLASDPASALAEKIRIQAYNNKKDYAKVIALGETAAQAQGSDEERSDVYFIVGVAYNSLYNAGGNKDASLKDKAVASWKKVTAGNSVDSAKAAIAELTK